MTAAGNKLAGQIRIDLCGQIQSGRGSDLGAAGVLGAGLPGYAAQLVVEDLCEVGTVELKINEAIEDAEIVVGIAGVAPLEPLNKA